MKKDHRCNLPFLGMKVDHIEATRVSHCIALICGVFFSPNLRVTRYYLVVIAIAFLPLKFHSIYERSTLPVYLIT